MAIVSRIIHKLGIGVPATDDLEVGELAQDRATGDLYGKTDDGNVFKVGTAGDGDAGYDDTEIRADLAQEVDDREAGDLALDGKITVEIADREAGDTALSGRVDAEVADRIAGDANLQDQIDALGTVGSELVDGDAYIRLEDGSWVASPSMTFEGDLTVNGNITIEGGGIVDPDGNPAGGLSTHVGPNAPDPAVEGQMWLNTDDGYLYVYYDNAGNPTWMAVEREGGSGGGGGGSNSSDPYWNNVELQLRFKDITQPWKDDAKDRVVTPAGDAIISGEEFKHPSFSLTINKGGSTNHGLEVDEFRAGSLTGLWTAEAWIYPINSAGTAGTSKRTILAGSKDNTGSDSSFRIFQYGDNFQFTVRGYDGTQNVNIVSAGDKAVLGEWQHIAISNDGNLYRVFHNGKLLMTEVSVSANQTEARYIEVGRSRGNNAKAFSGYIDDVRITDRVCRYTDDFEPPGELPTAGTRSLMLEQKGGDNDADLS